jgi:hypothetical protein
VHVNVLRGKMLAMLMDAHRVSQLKFFYTHAGFADRSTFKRFFAPCGTSSGWNQNKPSKRNE